MARPDEIKDLAAASSFGALAETDNAGRFRLENVPPGRYYIVAGRVDAPTYYPGTVQASEGKVVLITPGLTISGIDFVLNNGSVGRANPDLGGAPSWVIPIQTRIEGGGKTPLFAGGQFPVLRLTRYTGARTDVSLNTPSVTVSEPGYLNNPAAVADYRVTIENLPDTYSLKSLTFGSTDLRVDALKLPKANAGSTVTQSIIVTLTIPSAPAAGGSSRQRTNSGRCQALRSTFPAIQERCTPMGHLSSLESLPVDTSSCRSTIPAPHVRWAPRLWWVTGISQYRTGGYFRCAVELRSACAAVASERSASGLPDAHPFPFTDEFQTVKLTSLSMPVRSCSTATTVIPFLLNDDGKFDIPKPSARKLSSWMPSFSALVTVSRTIVLDEQDTTIELTLTPKIGE